MRIDASSGKSSARRPEICSGLHARRPPAVLATRLVAALPRDLSGPRTRVAVGPPDLAGQALRHVLAQPVVGRELGGLRALGALLGMPLRHRRPVLELAAARRGVAPQLPRDRRRRAPELAARSRARPCPRRAAGRSPRARRSTGTAPTAGRSETVGIPPPSRNHRTPTGAETPADGGRLLARCALGDRLPEPPPMIHPPDRRPARRPHRRPPRLLPRPQPSAHRNLLSSRCCDDRVESAQYTSHDFGQVLDDHQVLQSIGSVGDAYDNAMAESFVDSFKTELIADRVWRTRPSSSSRSSSWVAWFNNDRLHEVAGDIPPAEFEALYAAPDRAISCSTTITRKPLNPVSAKPSPAHSRCQAHGQE